MTTVARTLPTLSLHTLSLPTLPLPTPTLLGHPVELDQRLLASLVEQAEGVDAKAGHVAVGLGNAHIVQQEGELCGREVGEGRVGVPC